MRTAQNWNDRYQNDDFPWDIGGLSPAIKGYVDQLKDKTIKILIPGAGHAHEAEYLYKQGYSNVYVCDWAELALQEFSNRCPGFPKDKLLCTDFFKIEDRFDLIIEQTFFCALDPELRKDYKVKMHELLKPNGVLVGLFFGIIFPKHGPPFGGEMKEYRALFFDQFSILEMAITDQSIEPRKGNELFFRMMRI